jgi:hypothetical protein
MVRSLLIVGAAMLVVAACTAGGGAGSEPAEPSIVSQEPGGEFSLPPSVTDPIVGDAAARLGVDPSEVAIVAAEAKTFSDGSLGCPEPGMMYTQALVDGYQVIVEANGQRLDYRGSGPGQFKLCENP